MTRAVFDANVLVSGLVATTGPLAQLLDRWRSDEIEVIISGPILREIEAAWAKPYWRSRLSQLQVDRLLTLLRTEATIVPLSAEVRGVATHPEDDAVLATALSADAPYLVTGDRELLRLRRFKSTVILSPNEFLSIVIR